MVIRLLIASLIVALLGCLCFAYLWIDRAITLSYVDQEEFACKVSSRQLENLLESTWRGRPAGDVLADLKREAAKEPANAYREIHQEGDAIWLGQVRFKFENGRLKEVGGD